MTPKTKRETTTTRLLTGGLALCVFALACGDGSGEGDVAQDQEVGVSAEEFRAVMQDMRTEIRRTLDEFGAEIAALDARYTSASEEVADEWREARNEIRAYREALEADLARLESAGEDEVQRLTDGMAQDLEALTEKVQRAELEAAESPTEFVAAARDGLAEVEQDLAVLGEEIGRLPDDARDAASDELRSFGSQVDRLRVQVDELAEAAAEEVSEVREEISEDISSLTASVQRERFEARQHRTSDEVS